MAYRYKKDNPKSKRKLVIAFFIIIVFIALFIAIVAGFFGSNYVVQKSLEDPDVVLHVAVSGGDLIVTVYEWRRVEELRMLVIEIEGVSLPSSMTMMPAALTGTGAVYFTNTCVGVTGVRKVGVRGIFTDGSSTLLKLSTIKFT
ncbi:hypothetical protein [uncultured Methanocorpusculum sp.]|nr:hypothetical protein [uncultured Methanocorpusculum sp.]